MRIWAIALNTFREATRNRVFYMILIFIVLMLLSSAALGMLSLGEQDRVVKHLGLSAMNIFGLMLAMFVGVALVHEELENKTIYTLMSAGVSRGQFLFGKFLGLTMTIVVNITMMTLLLTLLIFMTPGSHLTVSVYQAALMSLFEMMIIIAIAILFSVVTSPVLAMILTFLMWVIGMMSQSLQLFALRLGELGHSVAKYVILGILLFLPRLDVFNLKDEIVYSEVLDFRYLYMFYGLLYTGAVLAVSNFIFSRKDFQ
ncbi:MAG TPA: ABC transporter permease subunit [bacterium]|nr:ABC transporter permease subunit [bacterium]